MAKLQDIKRINREDFPEEYKSLIDTLSNTLNTFMEDVLNAMRNNIDNDNLKREIKDITVIVSNATTGALKSSIVFKNNLSSRIKGITVIKVDNLTDASQPTSLPLINFSENNSQVTISSVIGLPVDKQFRVRIETIA